jgi:hypothetical protein
LTGALIGAAIMLPVGTEIRDGGPGCTACGSWTVTLGGFHLRDAAPVWAMLLSITIGALLGAGLMALVGSIGREGSSRRTA